MLYLEEFEDGLGNVWIDQEGKQDTTIKEYVACGFVAAPQCLAAKGNGKSNNGERHECAYAKSSKKIVWHDAFKWHDRDEIEVEHSEPVEQLLELAWPGEPERPRKPL